METQEKPDSEYYFNGWTGELKIDGETSYAHKSADELLNKALANGEWSDEARIAFITKVYKIQE